MNCALRRVLPPRGRHVTQTGAAHGPISAELRRRSSRGQKPSRSTTKVAQIYAARFSCLGQARSEVQRLVELKPRDRGLLPHVTKDRALGS